MSSPTSTTSTDKSKTAVSGDSNSAGTSSGSGRRPAVIARLKDVTSVSEPPSTTPHIPPPVWGHVLDFMPYEEVSSALFVGKIITNEAVKYVRTLNFMKGYQLDVPSARRFASVEEVNCLCLISGEWRNTVLCRDTTIRLVPLLATFPKLKSIHVGGLFTGVRNGQEQLVRRSYNPRYCSSPENHKELAKSLLHRPDFPDCAGEFAVLEKVARREGARELFRRESGTYFCDVLYDCLLFHWLEIFV